MYCLLSYLDPRQYKKRECVARERAVDCKNGMILCVSLNIFILSVSTTLLWYETSSFFHPYSHSGMRFRNEILNVWLVLLNTDVDDLFNKHAL